MTTEPMATEPAEQIADVVAAVQGHPPHCKDAAYWKAMHDQQVHNKREAERWKLLFKGQRDRANAVAEAARDYVDAPSERAMGLLLAAIKTWETD